MAFSFIYTGYNPESGEIDVTINGKDYRAHLNPADIASFEKKLKTGNKVDAMNFLKNRTMGGLKQVHDQPLNDSRMADLDLLGQDWDMGMTNKEREALCSKAKCHQDYWHFDWHEIPQQDQVKLYQASGGRMAKPLKEIQAGADTEAKLREFYQLSQKLAKLTKEVKAIQAQIGGIEEDIISELERAEDNALETKEFFARIQRKGYERESPKYKEAFDFLLSKVNPALKRIAEEALEATKTISKVKASISVGQQGKPIMELRVWDRVKNLLRQIASKISGYNSTIEQALGQVNAKLAEVRHFSIAEVLTGAEASAAFPKKAPGSFLSHVMKVCKATYGKLPDVGKEMKVAIVPVPQGETHIWLVHEVSGFRVRQHVSKKPTA